MEEAIVTTGQLLFPKPQTAGLSLYINRNESENTFTKTTACKIVNRLPVHEIYHFRRFHCRTSNQETIKSQQ